MRIEHFERLDVRGDHRYDRALLLALQLGRAKHAQRAEYLVAQHREQAKRDVVIAVLLGIAQRPSQHAEPDRKAHNPAVRQGDVFPERLGDADRAHQRHAHCADKPETAVNNGDYHYISERSEQDNQSRHNLAAVHSRILFSHCRPPRRDIPLRAPFAR